MILELACSPETRFQTRFEQREDLLSNQHETFVVSEQAYFPLFIMQDGARDFKTQFRMRVPSKAAEFYSGVDSNFKDATFNLAKKG